jgi:effector-binding domain-containing protein
VEKKALRPSIKAICTTHKGSYEKLNQAYKALMDYACRHGLNHIHTVPGDLYQGAGNGFRGNEDNYVTEIIIPY